MFSTAMSGNEVDLKLRLSSLWHLVAITRLIEIVIDERDDADEEKRIMLEAWRMLSKSLYKQEKSGMTEAIEGEGVDATTARLVLGMIGDLDEIDGFFDKCLEAVEGTLKAFMSYKQEESDDDSSK